jgi:hypothetical protein
VTPKQYASIVLLKEVVIYLVTVLKPDPVVFTSSKNVVTKTGRGDWGGIVICGKAINNQGN